MLQCTVIRSMKEGFYQLRGLRNAVFCVVSLEFAKLILNEVFFNFFLIKVY